MSVNCATNFYQASCPEILYRTRHDHIGPAAFVRALLQSRGKSFVQHPSYYISRAVHGAGGTFGSAGAGKCSANCQFASAQSDSHPSVTRTPGDSAPLEPASVAQTVSLRRLRVTRTCRLPGRPVNSSGYSGFLVG